MEKMVHTKRGSVEISKQNVDAVLHYKLMIPLSYAL